MLKTISVFTGNRGFRKYVDDRKPKIRPAAGFKEVLQDAIARAK